MTQEKYQKQEAITEGLPPVMNKVYDDPAVRKVYPFADLLREQLKTSTVRPFTPNYSDVTLAIQDSLHPPAKINPQAAIDTLKSRLKTRRRRRDVLMAVAAQTRGHAPRSAPRTAA